VGSLGYLLTFRLLDSHIRSTDPTTLGWLVCLVCYVPFWGVMRNSYFTYDDDLYWGHWLAGLPALQLAWGISIIALLAIYTWATVSFGIRFSNLTHRGILTNGPYRLSKHPAYLTKNLSFWLISIPFVIHGDATESLRQCLLLGGVNMIYYWRAKTEETHLARDPVYRAYSSWITEHGVVARLKRVLLALAGCRGANFSTPRSSWTTHGM
jgi:protein-S-isoprenylcysteine O-methyltransferase Ste14